jgi:hypothetical protein
MPVARQPQREAVNGRQKVIEQLVHCAMTPRCRRARSLTLNGRDERRGKRLIPPAVEQSISLSWREHVC